MQNDTKRRIISTVASEEDIRNDDTLRPKFLTDYIGQKKAKEMMKVYIEAAKGRKEPLDHVIWTSGTWQDHPCRHYSK